MDVQEHFPLTRAHLHGRVPQAKTVAEFVEGVCAAHAKGDIPSRAVRDLVRYEALLHDLPTPAPPEPILPRDDERCVLAPHVRVLDFGAGLHEAIAALREGKPATPRPCRGWLVLWRGGELTLFRETGWLLQAFAKPTRIEDAIEDDEDRALFHEWWRLGIVQRA